MPKLSEQNKELVRQQIENKVRLLPAILNLKDKYDRARAALDAAKIDADPDVKNLVEKYREIIRSIGCEDLTVLGFQIMTAENGYTYSRPVYNRNRSYSYYGADGEAAVSELVNKYLLKFVLQYETGHCEIDDFLDSIK